MGNGQDRARRDLEELQTGSLGCWLRSEPLLPKEGKARERPEIAGQQKEREQERKRENEGEISCG